MCHPAPQTTSNRPVGPPPPTPAPAAGRLYLGQNPQLGVLGEPLAAYAVHQCQVLLLKLAHSSDHASKGSRRRCQFVAKTPKFSNCHGL